MPFSGFRDRLGSSSKQERDLRQSIRGTSHLSHNDGTSDSQSIITTSTVSSSSSSTAAGSMSAVAEQLRNRPMTADPVQFVQDAIAPLFTYNSKHEQATLEEIKEHHVPKYFAPDYTHTFNLTEDADLNSWLQRTRAVHQNCKRTRIRFLKSLIDTAERQSMQHALVSLQYEVIITVHNREDDIKILAHGIYRIKQGKLISGTIVVDLHEATVKGPELPSCVIA
ncbi:hypothetical protein P389DRAFT_76340 [Cystobasidium minutum MCA 4210]|uniref:uncharacterized protein n=1 Tax=Cystobasidium minutum MCA 4210 TaxID=1397322 RepID=UPI0034CF0E43|eukprot:jgi/Rhomi1/76340/CE76339_285